MLTFTLGIVLVSLILYVFHLAINANKYWKQRGLKTLKPVLFLGNTLPIVLKKQHLSEIYMDLNKAFPDEQITGFYDNMKPRIIIQDPDYIEKVLIKDFVHFTDHGFLSPDECKQPIDYYQLFTMKGSKWRAFRYKMSPLFTSGKLKQMFQTFDIVGEKLINYIESKPNKEFVMRDAMHLYSLDFVGLAVFGLNPSCLENPGSEFHRMGTNVFDMNYYKMAFNTLCPKLFYKFGFSFNNPKAVKYFCKVIQDAFNYRKEHNIKRNDFIQMMMQLKEKGKIEIHKWDPNDDYLKEDDYVPSETFGEWFSKMGASTSLDVADVFMDSKEQYYIMSSQNPYHKYIDVYSYVDYIFLNDASIMAQAYTFMTTGLEGIAIATMLSFYDMAIHQEIQNKARVEILEQIKSHSGLTYEALKSMTYLENILNESLRFHPLSQAIFRVCTKDYTFPNGYTIKEGESLHIPQLAIHMNPDYHRDPLEFKPERFDYPMKTCTYFPFGDGPRVCIAMRFALLQIKYALAKVISEYNVKLSPKTEIPLKMKPQSIMYEPIQTVYFDLEKV